MPMITITPELCATPAEAPVEMVERKGIGHPDTLCDALAETISAALCRYYLDHFGLILHHNVDKALLWGGSSQPGFGGGHVEAPMEIFLAGRATRDFMGREIPIDELVTEAARRWLQETLHALDVDRDVKLHTLIRSGSTELVNLYLRQRSTGVALANDTSCGVGYAPLNEVERLVLAVEAHLNAAATKAVHPEIGEDIKVMAVREGSEIALTIGCAFVDRYIADMDDYVAKKNGVANLALQEAQCHTDMPVEVAVNSADDIDSGNIYLTVTGTSAEAGDDGQVGRGNRVNGLITPYRPMNMEAAAGKNPVTHVGKLYNILARQICIEIVGAFDAITEARCYLVSCIGQPVSEPQVVDVRVRVADPGQVKAFEREISAIIHGQLQATARVQEQLLAGALKVY